MTYKSINPSELGSAIAELLAQYHEGVIDGVNAAGKKAVKRLVKLTKSTAPKNSGDFAKSITYTTTENPGIRDKKYTWGAKAPHHRITHLLVNGHETVNGGRVPGDPFLENALETVLPEYESDIKEAIKNDK